MAVGQLVQLLSMLAAQTRDTQVRDAPTDSSAATLPGEARNTVLPRVDSKKAELTVLSSVRSRFEELNLLGAGGMGEVVLAQDHDINRAVALKRLPPNASLHQLLRFADEIRTVGQLEHPSIVPLHDVGIDSSGRYYFVMKALQGETMEAIIARLAAKDPDTLARFPLTVRVQVFQAVLNAIAYAHQQGFIHRDIKPANIMVGAFGEVTVVDWGLAKRVRTRSEPNDLAPGREGTAHETQVGAILGTPLYMSPEQAQGANDTLDERSDIYSLCVLFHEWLSGEHYLKGLTETRDVLTAVKNKKPALTDMMLQVPGEYAWFLDKGLEKDPSLRFQSVVEMQSELQRILIGECRIQCERTLAKRALGETANFLDRNPVAAMVGLASLLAFAITGVIAVMRWFF